MKPLGVLAALSVSALAVAPPPAPGPEIAWEWLKYGNERHAASRPVHWHQSVERRRQVAGGERPHAIVLSCSDSRVPPEIVFDQGLGDIHVVRVAGNAAGDRELATIEYAAGQLGAPVLVVLGHEGCGVVEAAVAGTRMPGHMGVVLASLSAAVEVGRTAPGDPVANATRANVESTMRQLRLSEPVLARLVAERRLKVAGGIYKLGTGVVEWLGEAASEPKGVSRMVPQKH